MASINASGLIIPAFHDVLGDIFARGHVHYWLHGGRGSTKSSFISLAIVLLVVNFPFANAVVVRRFGNTLRDSVYQQLLWAISELGLDSYFRARLSPMEITYLPTGQKIIFRGADDPLKLKGVKFPRGMLLWCGWKSSTSSRASRRCGPFSTLFGVAVMISGASIRTTLRARCGAG